MGSSWHFCPHLQDVLQDHVHVTIKRSDSGKNFAIVTKSDEHLRVRFDGFEKQRERTLREGIFRCYFLFFFFHSCVCELLFFFLIISWGLIILYCLLVSISSFSLRLYEIIKINDSLSL